MANWRFHPACLLFPPLSDEDLQSLADDIKKNGQLQPITTLDGMILDGRNRLLACKIAKVEPRFEEWTGTGSPLEWAISANLHRRHLTASQRAVLALEVLPLREQEAKERQRLSTGRGKKVAKSLATSRGKASQIAAKLAGTNSAYVEQIKGISRKAPELIPEIKNGSLTVAEASRLSKLDSSQRENFFEAMAQHPDQKFAKLIRMVLPKHDPTPDPENTTPKAWTQVWCGDSLEVIRHRLQNVSVDIICTSPPFNHGVQYGNYGDDIDPVAYEAWLDEVFREFREKLPLRGSLFLIVGHSPRRPWTAIDMAKIAGKYFTLQNQIVWVKSITINGESKGHFTPIAGDKYLNRNWDFVFHFTKARMKIDRKAIGVPYADPINAIRAGDGDGVRCAGDVWFVPFPTIHSGEDRANHPNPFPPELAERCLKLAGYNKDTVVLDPFCGVNGLKAANRLGINAIGIDKHLPYCEATALAAGAQVKKFPDDDT